MTEHWIDKNKHRAKEAFEKADDTKPPTKELDAQPLPQAPHPQLTPDGPMREIVDRQVREKQEAIRAKFARDRQIERQR